MHRARRWDRGFTLIEILVVIAIIAVLAGMLVGVTNMVRKKAEIAKCKSNISAVAIALEAYNTNNGMYPMGALPGKAQDDPWQLFLGLYTANIKIGGSRDNHLADWPVDQIGRWRGSYAETYEGPTEAELDFTSGVTSQLVFLDPWGRAFHYVEFESRAQTDRQLQGGQLKAKGGQSYAIWSDGPDRKNDWGKNDDVTSWSDVGRSAGTKTGTKSP